MKEWSRRLRGILGTATIWGGCGAALGGLLGGITGMMMGGSILIWVLDGVVQFGALGLGTGAVFAGLLTTFDGAKRLRQLSAGRAALWGAAAGLALPSVAWALSGAAIPVLPVAIATGLGGLLGGTSVTIARTELRTLPRRT